MYIYEPLHPIRAHLSHPMFECVFFVYVITPDSVSLNSHSTKKLNSYLTTLESLDPMKYQLIAYNQVQPTLRFCSLHFCSFFQFSEACHF